MALARSGWMLRRRGSSRRDVAQTATYVRLPFQGLAAEKLPRYLAFELDVVGTQIQAAEVAEEALAKPAGAPDPAAVGIHSAAATSDPAGVRAVRVVVRTAMSSAAPGRKPESWLLCVLPESREDISHETSRHCSTVTALSRWRR